MTDFTTQITASSTAEQVADVIIHHWGISVHNTLRGSITEAVSALLAARARGFTPGERMPPFETEILVSQGGGRRYIAWFKDAAEWDELKARYVRWWHLPGEGR